MSGVKGVDRKDACWLSFTPLTGYFIFWKLFISVHTWDSKAKKHRGKNIQQQSFHVSAKAIGNCYFQWVCARSSSSSWGTLMGGRRELKWLRKVRTCALTSWNIRWLGFTWVHPCSRLFMDTKRRFEWCLFFGGHPVSIFHLMSGVFGIFRMCLLWEDLSETKQHLASALLGSQGRLGGAFPQRQPWNVGAISEFPCSLRVHGCRQYMHASANYKDVPRAYRDQLVTWYILSTRQYLWLDHDCRGDFNQSVFASTRSRPD